MWGVHAWKCVCEAMSQHTVVFAGETSLQSSEISLSGQKLPELHFSVTLSDGDEGQSDDDEDDDDGNGNDSKYLMNACYFCHSSRALQKYINK